MGDLDSYPVLCLAAEWTGSVPAAYDQDSASAGQLCVYPVSNSPYRMPLFILIFYLLGSREWWAPFSLGAGVQLYQPHSSLAVQPQPFLWEGFLIIHLYLEQGAPV